MLCAAAMIALLLANSPLEPRYAQLLELPVAIQIGDLAIAKPLLLWVNDGRMAVFLMLVGLEVKREIMEGELSNASNAALPLVAALGGMAGPALVYLACNWGDEEALRGWGSLSASNWVSWDRSGFQPGSGSQRCRKEPTGANSMVWRC